MVWKIGGRADELTLRARKKALIPGDGLLDSAANRASGDCRSGPEWCDLEAKTLEIERMLGGFVAHRLGSFPDKKRGASSQPLSLETPNKLVDTDPFMLASKKGFHQQRT